MLEKYITLRQAMGLTGHADPSELRRAAERGDLQAQRLNARMWMTKASWVEAWQNTKRRHVGERSKDKQPRTRGQSRPPKEQPL